ncbi:MAG: PQQ-dependent sugar dehydrogenase [Methylophagaceae bacterium]
MEKYFRIFTTVLLLSFSHSIFSAGETPLKVDIIASGLGVPWGMVLMPDNKILITQRQGNVSLLNLNNQQIQSISGLPKIKVAGQGGLFDVALSPHYKTDSWIYFSYVKEFGGQGATTLARAKLNEHALVDWQDVLITKSTSSKNVHFGGRIIFDNDDHLFLSVGDRGVRSNAQNRMNHAGSILRLNLDGSIPKDNPFVHDQNALAEIWSYGHRNPQGLFFNKITGLLWESEHGPRGGDEINIIKTGKNYGWPDISHGKEYWGPLAVGEGTERDDIESPIKVYIPSIGTSNIIQHSGNTFPAWKNNLFVGALKSQHLNRIVIDDNNQASGEFRHFSSVQARIRNIFESPEGWLYLATDQGEILLIKP